MKYIVVTGGVISGLGKGITASSIGLLLKSEGLNVTAIKIDPYLNIDAGTMSPYEHGECYVLKDGGEADLDLGNYERFLDIELTKDHNITTGKIYQSVISKEREGEYLGKTVQIIPHITDEIQDWIKRASRIPVDNDKNPDVCIIEMGGTVGDIENAPFVEAIRQMQIKSRADKFFFVHVSMVIDNGELKTKPTQHSVSTLRSLGIFPDMLVIRTKDMLPYDIIKKLSIFCHVSENCIISNTDVKNIYYVPYIFKTQNICACINKKLNFDLKNENSLDEYFKVIKHFESDIPKFKLAIVGKYTGSPDTYLSLIRAIEHASFLVNVHIDIEWINSEKLDKEKLQTCSCIIIPGGFGSRGISGKLEVAKYARENSIPILGICLGMQIMVVDCWRAIGFKGGSSEWKDVKDSCNENDNIIDILPNQTGIKGGTMRLGNYTTTLTKDSKVEALYKNNTIFERHRHRYEVNNSYISLLEDFGLIFSGKSKTDSNELMEIVELKNHPYYVGCQFHPEYKSRYNKPHPLFVGLLKSLKTNSI